MSPNADARMGLPGTLSLQSLHGSRRCSECDVICFMDGERRRTLTYNINGRVTMTKSRRNSPTLPLAGVVLALSAAALLGGCVVRVAEPPPPRAYVAPPPAYVEPAVDVEVRATEAPPPLPDY